MPLAGIAYSVISETLFAFSKIAIIVTAIIDSVLVLSHLQNPETGEFSIQLISEVNLGAFLAVSAVGIFIYLSLVITASVLRAKCAKNEKDGK